MYAIAIDGELIGTELSALQVSQNLRLSKGKVEVASFDQSRREWLPVCLDHFMGRSENVRNASAAFQHRLSPHGQDGKR